MWVDNFYFAPWYSYGDNDMVVTMVIWEVIFPLIRIIILGDDLKPLTDDKALRKHEIEVKKYGEDCKNSNENFIKDHYKTVEEGLALFQDDPLIYRPGEDYEYSSLAYSVVSHVIELVSGKDYPSYMKKVCKDLGMRLTKVDLNDPITYNRSMYDYFFIYS